MKQSRPSIHEPGRGRGQVFRGVLPKASAGESVILSNAKNLATDETRPFAALLCKSQGPTENRVRAGTRP